ncbi:hypothetical protein [Rhizorhabdus wittichii]
MDTEAIASHRFGILGRHSRESGNPRSRSISPLASRRPWIPAFAGMTANWLKYFTAELLRTVRISYCEGESFALRGRT